MALQVSEASVINLAPKQTPARVFMYVVSPIIIASLFWATLGSNAWSKTSTYLGLSTFLTMSPINRCAIAAGSSTCFSWTDSTGGVTGTALCLYISFGSSGTVCPQAYQQAALVFQILAAICATVAAITGVYQRSKIAPGRGMICSISSALCFGIISLATWSKFQCVINGGSTGASSTFSFSNGFFLMIAACVLTLVIIISQKCYESQTVSEITAVSDVRYAALNNTSPTNVTIQGYAQPPSTA